MALILFCRFLHIAALITDVHQSASFKRYIVRNAVVSQEQDFRMFFLAHYGFAFTQFERSTSKPNVIMKFTSIMTTIIEPLLLLLSKVSERGQEEPLLPRPLTCGSLSTKLTWAVQPGLVSQDQVQDVRTENQNSAKSRLSMVHFPPVWVKCES